MLAWLCLHWAVIIQCSPPVSRPPLAPGPGIRPKPVPRLPPGSHHSLVTCHTVSDNTYHEPRLSGPGPGLLGADVHPELWQPPGDTGRQDHGDQGLQGQQWWRRGQQQVERAGNIGSPLSLIPCKCKCCQYIKTFVLQYFICFTSSLMITSIFPSLVLLPDYVCMSVLDVATRQHPFCVKKKTLFTFNFVIVHCIISGRKRILCFLLSATQKRKWIWKSQEFPAKCTEPLMDSMKALLRYASWYFKLNDVYIKFRPKTKLLLMS